MDRPPCKSEKRGTYGAGTFVVDDDAFDIVVLNIFRNTSRFETTEISADDLAAQPTDVAKKFTAFVQTAAISASSS